jgi:hypothetical protein
MKTIISIFLSITIFIILMISCEKHKDPFSTLNKKPTIEVFSFDDDSLKYNKEEPFKIKLKYSDDEDQKLTATFKFVSGHGDVFHSSFTEVSKGANSVTFDAPSNFDSNVDGRINFIPDTTGKVEIELELSDKVKQMTQKAATFFFSNLKPVASFTYRLLTNVSPYELEVDAKESHDPDHGTIEYYYWLFGDGTPELRTKANTYRYKYQQSGTYTVRLKIIDNDGGIDSTIKVVPTNNQPPLAMLQVEPKSGEAPLTITYTATNSIDPDGQVVAYRIDFDDGTSALDSAGTHVYNTDKNYRIRLSIQDNLGQTDTTGVTVKVATPPIAVLKVSPKEGPFPLDCIIDGSDSYDPQGGKLEHDIYINGNLRYDNVDSVVHAFDTPATYFVRLKVTSKRNGLTDEKQQAVTVFNINPTADFIWEPATPQHRTPVTYTSTSIDSNLTDEITYYKWTFPFGIKKVGKDSSIVHLTFDAGVDTYKVTLEVLDKFNGRDIITKIIPKK